MNPSLRLPPILSRPDGIVWTPGPLPTDCWVFAGRKHPDGYGRVKGGGRMRQAHRVLYEALVGPIPDGLTIDHLCRVRACVNPLHLEPVTNRENILRGEGWPARNARKTHCAYGHPFDEANTYVDPSGRRTCRACRREVDRRREARHAT